MKPASFDYLRPTTIEEACALLAQHAEARPIAGGQTLVPMMAMRLARPTHLVDIARISGLAGIHEEPDAIVFGAVTRQVEAERSSLVAARLPLLARALPWIGHQPTRNRGTIGGSIANADPAAEIPLVLVTLAGSVTVRDQDGQHTIAAHDLFVGPMTTSLSASAIITRARFPVWRETHVGTSFHEVSARKSDFAYVAVAAQLALDDTGRCDRLALGIGGATPIPTRLDAVAKTLVGTKLEPADVARAVEAALADIDIMQDAHASEGYRRRVAASLSQRAVADAKADALAKMKGGRA